jgi:hypothetical protein
MTDKITADSFVECTTRAKAKRHLSEKPTAQWGLSPLCDTAASGWDQQAVDMAMPPRWRNRTIIADLPPCKQCEKSRQRRIDGRPA